MGPELWLAIGLLVASGLLGAGYFVGRSTLKDDLRRLEEQRDLAQKRESAARVALEGERAKALERARGSRDDFAVDHSIAVADDDDGVLDAQFGPRPSPPPGKPGAPSDPRGT